ncbi:MAG TPA: trypsin-like peptidase domain-containing protein [Mycobacteriales bacterium]|nr:trypsin-like peptidase domain-containing protein [Mycobacteriales bacterium]
MTQPAADDLVDLEGLLVAATVRVDASGSSVGAGFQVAPGWVVTCAHVVGTAGVRVRVRSVSGASAEGAVRDVWPPASAAGLTGPPDLALVEMNSPFDVPCVRLDERWPQAGARLLACGLAESFDGVAPETVELGCSGQKLTPEAGVRLLKLGGETVVPGMSGGPVLSMVTGGVTGMVRTSHHTTLPAGGWAVPAELVRVRWPRVAAAHDAYHAADDRWRRIAEGWAALATDLFVPAVTWRDGLPPSAMLRPEYGLVDFVGRRDEVDGLLDWCARPEPFGLRLVTGPAGQGKTRLAAHVCSELGRRWVAGLLQTWQAAGGPLAGGADARLSVDLAERLAGCSAPLLLVVDYAETSPGLVLQLAGLLRDRAAITDAPGRLMLLARSAGDWLAELRSQADDGLAGLLGDGVVLPLEELVRAPDRDAEFRRAVAAFAVLRDGDPGRVRSPADLAIGRYERVLEVHAAALAALLDQADPVAAVGEAGPVERVLAHERRFWKATAAAADPPLPGAETDRLDQVVTAGTLYGAVATRDEAVAVLGRMPTFTEERAHVVDRYARWTTDLDPSGTWLYPLRPDRLGEDHAAQTVLRVPALVSALLKSAPDGEVPAAERTDLALTVLGRAAVRHPGLRVYLTALICDRLDLMPAAIRVTPTLADPGTVAAAVLTALHAEPPSSVEHARALLRWLPEHTLSLREAAAIVTAAEADHIRRRVKQMPEDETSLSDLAMSLNNLSVRLGELGRREEGLAAVEEAVRIRRRLAEARPDAFLPDLARSLRVQAWLLEQIGDADGAAKVTAEADHLAG